uniref:AlNc14C77G5141 protein n=1 Tax=Albugo laibachii Nc14 TaxID=890382 RepID=F0WEU1_9STRA|nr:AlNc14C77G5141 [Albugo laibachii Nc14]|eukprot:CCA19723.1 AlNc14C77G5141 [Albugo laibachii Nc14]
MLSIVSIFQSSPLIVPRLGGLLLGLHLVKSDDQSTCPFNNHVLSCIWVEQEKYSSGTHIRHKSSRSGIYMISMSSRDRVKYSCGLSHHGFDENWIDLGPTHSGFSCSTFRYYFSEDGLFYLQILKEDLDPNSHL